MVLQNGGELDISMITTLGVSVKETDSPIGFFGTGLKYAIAVLLRENVDFNITIGKNEYSFFTETKTIRGKSFEMCMMSGPYDTLELPFTTDFGKTWPLWMAFREIKSNVLDEGGLEVPKLQPIKTKAGTTTFYIEDREEFKGVFLEDTPKELVCETESLQIYTGSSEYVYYKGIRSKKLHNKSIFTYNILSDCDLTEDRTIAYNFEAEMPITKCIAKSKDKNFLQKIIGAPKGTFEYNIDMSWASHIKPSDEYSMVYTSTPEPSHRHKSYFDTHNYVEPKLTKFDVMYNIIDLCNEHDIKCRVDHDGNLTIYSPQFD